MQLPDARVEAILGEAYAAGGTRECALSTTVPVLSDGVYTNITEPAAGSYAREDVPEGDWVVAGRAAEAVVQFPDPVDDLGVIVAWVLYQGGVATEAGVPAFPMSLAPGASDVRVTVRIESPSDLTSL